MKVRRQRAGRLVGLAALGVAGAVMGVGEANAQGPVLTPISLRAGLSIPTSGSGDFGYLLGASVQFKRSAVAVVRGTISLDADWRDGGGGTDAEVFGLSVVQRVSISAPLGIRVPYVGAGIGLFSVRTTRDEPTPGGGTQSVSSSATRLGGKLLAGVNVTNRVFVEASYHLTGSVGGVRSDSLNLALGVRF